MSNNDYIESKNKIDKDDYLTKKPKAQISKIDRSKTAPIENFFVIKI